MLTTEEVAEKLGITRGRVVHLVTAGVIKAQKRGKMLFIEPAEVEKARKRKTKPGPTPAKKGSK